MQRTAITFLFFTVALVSYAQIVITAPEVPHSVGQQFQYYYQAQDSFQVNIGAPGGPQVWDFTQGDTSNISTDLYLDPAVSPPEYSRANVVIQTDQLNLFGLSEPGNLYCWLGPPRFILGAVTTAYQTTPIAIAFQPYINQYPLPLQYGATWSNTVNLDQIFQIPGYEIRIELYSTLNSSANAYGEVQTPLGNYPALRIRTNVTYDLTVYVRILFIWVPVLEQTGSSVNYDWRAENVGIVANVNTTSPDPGIIWASSMRRLLSATTISSESTPQSLSTIQSPQSFELLSNYPNPFNGETVISFQLEQEAEVDLRIFDLLGRQIAHLLQGYQEAGNHEITWQPEQLSAGLYVAQLRTGEQVQQVMMVYLK